MSEYVSLRADCLVIPGMDAGGFCSLVMLPKLGAFYGQTSCRPNLWPHDTLLCFQQIQEDQERPEEINADVLSGQWSHQPRPAAATTASNQAPASLPHPGPTCFPKTMYHLQYQLYPAFQLHLTLLFPRPFKLNPLCLRV